MSLVTLLILVVILGLVAYLIQQLPIAQPFKVVAYVILIIIALLYLLRAVPELPGF